MRTPWVFKSVAKFGRITQWIADADGRVVLTFDDIYSGSSDEADRHMAVQQVRHALLAAKLLHS